jgi:hypothetical protein
MLLWQEQPHYESKRVVLAFMESLKMENTVLFGLA